MSGLPKYWRYALEERLRNLREWINDNPEISRRLCYASFCLLVLVIVWIAWPRSEYRPATEPVKVWFYDLNTKKLFTANTDSIPPIAAPSGLMPDGKPAGVKAVVLSYVTEPNESERLVGFLQTTDANDKTRILVCTITDANWVSADTREGRLIAEQAFKPNDKGRMPHIYSPPYRVGDPIHPPHIKSERIACALEMHIRRVITYPNGLF